MARKKSAAAVAANDDIGEEVRLDLFRRQIEIRHCEQRAYDLFLENLVKGTSHLSLGQEAIAAGFATAMRPGDKSFCTYRGHAHTLSKGASMEGVLAELLGRANGLMYGGQSVGMAIAPDNGRTTGSLTRHADRNMYDAKNRKTRLAWLTWKRSSRHSMSASVVPLPSVLR